MKHYFSMLGLTLFGFSGVTLSADLHNYLGNVKSLSAAFEQVVQRDATSKQDRSQGTLIVQSPDKFRLEYNKPYKQMYIADGKKLWSFDEDLEQVTVKTQHNVLANTPAMILSNPANLEKTYKVLAEGTTDGVEWFALTPRNNESGFEKVRLGFVAHKLKLFEMHDSFGQRTQLRFENMTYNPKLKPNEFAFTPPAGVDVISDTEQKE